MLIVIIITLMLLFAIIRMPVLIIVSILPIVTMLDYIPMHCITVHSDSGVGDMTIITTMAGTAEESINMPSQAVVPGAMRRIMRRVVIALRLDM